MLQQSKILGETSDKGCASSEDELDENKFLFTGYTLRIRIYNKYLFSDGRHTDTGGSSTEWLFSLGIWCFFWRTLIRKYFRAGTMCAERKIRGVVENSASFLCTRKGNRIPALRLADG